MTAIKQSSPVDIDTIRRIHVSAFGAEEGPVIAELVSNLLVDPSAYPSLSLLAYEQDRAIGHILFTRVVLSGHETLSASLLCPLAVTPQAQSKGVGEKLIREGLSRLKSSGIGLVFVLGHPGYYPRTGFVPAGQFGLDAPYPIADKNADAWMVHALQPGLIGKVTGTLSCADALQQPAYWIE